MRRKVKRALALVAVCLLTTRESAAEPAKSIEIGRLFNNDFLGDGQDRWRTGSYTISTVVSDRQHQRLPISPGELLEWRFRSEIISPANTASPAPDDRRYAGSLSIGLHTHFASSGWETSLGFDLVATGPSTHVSDFQQAVHDLISQPVGAAFANQIEDKLHPTMLIELARPIALSENIVARPFIEAQAGVETFARAGVDITIGEQCQGVLRIRDVTTGQRYRAMSCDADGPAFLIGADMARVFDSRYLPSSQGYELTDSRARLRAGLEWRGERSYFFYGLTYLGEEFEAQNEGQVVGSLNLGFNF